MFQVNSYFNNFIYWMTLISIELITWNLAFRRDVRGRMVRNVSEMSTCFIGKIAQIDLSKIVHVSTQLLQMNALYMHKRYVLYVSIFNYKLH